MAARINELRQKRIDAAAAHTALLETHLTAAAGARGFSEEEKKLQAEAESLVASMDELIGAEEKRLAADTPKAGAKPSGRITAVKDNAEDQSWHSSYTGDDRVLAEQIGLGRWAMAVRLASMGHSIDPRLTKVSAAATGMNESSGELGGFAIPVEYAPGIEKSMFESGEILKRVDARTIQGNAITYTVLNETSRVDGSRQGGVLGYWLDEAATKTPSTMLLARLEMKLRKVAALGYMTDELLDDAPALGQELQNAFKAELTFQVENKIWRGAGAVTPLGFTIAPCFISVAKEAGQPGLTILSENLSKMWARLPARSQANAVWLINVDVQPQLDLLSIPAGTAALEPRFVNYGPDGILTIKGRPVIPVEYAETLGTLGDIVLADLKQYRLIRKASGIQEASSIHVAFTTDQTAFRAVYRVDGQPVPRAAITPFKGSATLSPFIGLADRA